MPECRSEISSDFRRTPNETPLEACSGDSLIQRLVTITRQCHQALQQNDYQGAYQCLLQREPVIQALMKNKISLAAVWQDLYQEEQRHFGVLAQAMAGRVEKISLIRQSKARNAQYKTRPPRSAGVTRGFA